tara:strand:- start:3117 stop:3662 length:546 start_codon:yes stop_codon:yes gene_type:complete
MKNIEPYLKYIKDSTEIDHLYSHLSSLETEINKVTRQISVLKNNLPEKNEIQVKVLNQVISDQELEKFFEPNKAEGGTILDENLTLRNFETSDDFKNLTRYQQENYDHIEPYLYMAQGAIDTCVVDNTLKNELYSIDECPTLQRFANKVVNYHLEDEDFTTTQKKELREIIFIFAKHTLKH